MRTAVSASVSGAVTPVNLGSVTDELAPFLGAQVAVGDVAREVNPCVGVKKPADGAVRLNAKDVMTGSAPTAITTSKLAASRTTSRPSKVRAPSQRPSRLYSSCATDASRGPHPATAAARGRDLRS